MIIAEDGGSSQEVEPQDKAFLSPTSINPIPLIIFVAQQFFVYISSVFSVPYEAYKSYRLWSSTVKQLNAITQQENISLVGDLHFSDLKNQVLKLSGAEARLLLQEVDKTAKALDNLLGGAEESVKNIVDRMDAISQSQLETEELNKLFSDLQAEADVLYKDTMQAFIELNKKQTTQVQTAVYSGLLTNVFRKLNDSFADAQELPMHRYCGCHIQTEATDMSLRRLAPTLRGNFFRNTYDKFCINLEKIEEEPLTDEIRLKHPSAVLLSQSFGGGHNVAQQAMTERFAKVGGHAYRVEADIEVLDAYYRFKRWTGKTGAEWSQYLLQNNYFRTIRFLGWVAKRQSPKSSPGLVHQFALSLLARGNMDIAIMLFSRHAKWAEEAAFHVGVGLADVATDIDYSVFGFSNNPPKNPFYRHLLMHWDDNEIENLSKVLPKEYIVEGGFPVRDPFLRSYDDSELVEIRKKYGEKYNIDQDAKIVVLLGGAEGIKDRCAETLLEQYPSHPRAQKIHLLVVCGKNHKKQQKLETRFNELESENLIQATSLGWTEAEELAELYAIGTLLISSKAGGGTVSEAVVSNIPILASDITAPHIHHERKNLEFIKKMGCGDSFSKADGDFVSKAAKMIEESEDFRLSHPNQEFHPKDSSRTSMQVLQELIQASSLLREKQEKVFSDFREESEQLQPLLQPDQKV